jgi:hypothetical protein
LQELLHEFKVSLDDSRKVKANLASLVNPFMVGVINDSFPIPKMLLTEISAAWAEILGARGYRGLEKLRRSPSAVEF